MNYKEAREIIIQLREQGIILKDISKTVNLSVWKIRTTLNANGLSRQRADTEPTPELIDKVVKLKKEGMNHTQVSKELGICVPFVSKICRLRGITKARRY